MDYSNPFKRIHYMQPTGTIPWATKTMGLKTTIVDPK